MSLSDMATNIVAELTIELNAEDTFNADILANKVSGAIRRVMQLRRYPASYTDDMIATDMLNYYDVCLNLALARYNRIGADLEESHNENGVSISYVDENKILSSVLPLARH